MLDLNIDRRIIYRGEEEIPLTKRELNLLVVFYTMGNRRLSLDFLIDTALANPIKVPQDKNIIHNLISRLRKKAGKGIILNSRKLGYLLAEEIQIVN